MASSARITDPPRTNKDTLIHQAIYLTSPDWLTAPPNAPHNSDARSRIIGESFALALIILITGTRLWVRASRNSIGADDWVIIPGALGCVAYHALDIGSNTVGCVGKHVYDCTYREIIWTRYVSDSAVSF